MLGKRIRQFIRSNRRSSAVQIAASGCEKFLRAWHNDSWFEFDTNGERFALSAFASWRGDKPTTAWDVGAHLGEWAEQAHALLAKAHVTSFEIMPPVAEKLIERHGNSDWITILAVGVSNQPGEVEVTWNRDHDSTNAITPRLSSKWFAGEGLNRVKCPVTTIDLLVKERQSAPDLLKIDVEGHESEVLEGARELLASERAPSMIQFEYGETWIPAGRLLHDQQAFLEECGYSIGRLYPDHVAFKRYEYADEHFRMGNMIAVRDESLRKMLAG